MLWQDLLITGVGIVLSTAMLPQVWNGFTEKKGPIRHATSTPTFLGLYVMAYAYATLGLWLSTILICCTGTLWLLLFLQRLRYG